MFTRSEGSSTATQEAAAFTRSEGSSTTAQEVVALTRSEGSSTAAQGAAAFSRSAGSSTAAQEALALILRESRKSTQLALALTPSGVEEVDTGGNRYHLFGESSK